MQPYPTVQNYGYVNNPYGYPQQPQQLSALNGQMVGSLDEVKGKDVDLSGNPTWYPKIDGTEVYRKQLQPDGTSKILTYTLSQDGMREQTKQIVDADMLNALFEQFKQDLMTEISGIKDLVGTSMPIPTESPKTQRGGNQK